MSRTARPPTRWVLCLALASFALSAAPSRAAVFEVVPERSTDGVYQLRWSVEGEVAVVESVDPDFSQVRPVYLGTDRATVVTGRSDGTYYYRLLAPDGEFHSELAVSVEHHTLSRALGLLLLGGFVFVATVALVLRGPEEDTARG